MKRDHTKKIDVGYIRIDKSYDLVKGLAFIEPQILDNVITIGYPKIPLSTKAEIVSQKGEINTFIKDMYQNKYCLFSAITRPGNSGGPIFSEKGYRAYA
ncbi:MAG: hypothetical protein HQL02_13615 [Nitrospirae bacterium]|nr:hypothetical protein [Nitrospirota bacterium]